MYDFKSRVRFSEVDKDRKLELSSIINYFQDCTTFQSEDLKIGIDFLNEQKRAWIMNGWQIIIDRFPTLCETITIGTWAYGFDTIYGYRNFIIKDEQDQICVRANSIWVYMDLLQYRPTKLSEDVTKLYKFEEKLDLDYAPRKIKIPDCLTTHDTFLITASQLDMYNHVNNSQYIKMAENFLPKNFPVKQLRAEYKKSAHLGDKIHPYTCQTDHRCTIVLSDAQGKPYTIVEITS